MKFFFLVLLLSSCASHKASREWKVYTPKYFEEGDSIRAMCFDGVLEAAPPKCADVGWCAQYGYSFDYSDGPPEGEECFE